MDAKAPVVLEGATCGLKRWPNLAGFHVLSARLMMESGNSAGALEVCRDWIQQVAEEITRKGTENTEDTGDAAEITSQYTHYTHKTQGKHFNPLKPRRPKLDGYHVYWSKKTGGWL